jgi:saccharopine dehydrogenase (NADP+, L-glutamate forming)
MDAEVKAAGLMFMCEMGLDPGIDHMTASQIIHGIQKVSGVITSFKSYCGGLVAPESDDNPWHYKISWNPKNIVTAGADGAAYLHNGKQVQVPYQDIFNNNKKIKVNGIGALAYYPNRDSLRYLSLYAVPEAQTFLRATLRYPIFCQGWQVLVDLGLTDTTDVQDRTQQTFKSWIKEKMAAIGCTGSWPDYLHEKLKNHPKVLPLIEWLALTNNAVIGLKQASSADILLSILEKKWAMDPADKDMVVMQHEVAYISYQRKVSLTSSMVLKGEENGISAMAKTVGLPIGILAMLVLTNRVKPIPGVHIPNMQTIYRPVLTELKHHGIYFEEQIG